MTIKFYKFQGTGNDFIIIDDRDLAFKQDEQVIEKLCNRRFGIGADGLILLQNHPEADFFMKYFNSDGKESSMCGNGGRCISAFYHFLGNVKQVVSFLATDGPHEATVKLLSTGKYEVELGMKDVSHFQHIVDDIVLNTGSPHYVRFKQDDITGCNLIEIAQQIRYNDTYKQTGINVNLVNEIDPNHIRIRTYERGVENETLSCGTGATASAIALALKNKLISGNYEIKTDVAGGTLVIRYQYDSQSNSFSQVQLCGPAHFVFSGEIAANF